LVPIIDVHRNSIISIQIVRYFDETAKEKTHSELL